MGKKRESIHIPAMAPQSDLHLCFARIRIIDGAAAIDSDVNNSGIAAVDIEGGRLHVTLNDQPAGRPLVLCQGARCVYGNEYREFYLLLEGYEQADEFVDVVCIHQ
ncbi:MAG: hypothetical protein GX421_12525 [Caldisericales bacterium]|nr:hypothetical protein [Caldisericales bacterium]